MVDLDRNPQVAVQVDNNNNVVVVQNVAQGVHEIVDIGDLELDSNGNWRRRRLVRQADGSWRRTGRLSRVNYQE